MAQFDHLYKLVVLGDEEVGKSALLNRFCHAKFSEEYISTIGVDFAVKVVQMDGKNIKIQLWDTAGQERFRTITSSYYRGAHGILVLFDVSSRKTFASVKGWMSSVEKNADDTKAVLVGTKTDLAKREVSEAEGQEMARLYNMPYCEISAKSQDNVTEPFLKLLVQIMDGKSGSERPWWKKPKLTFVNDKEKQESKTGSS